MEEVHKGVEASKKPTRRKEHCRWMPREKKTTGVLPSIHQNALSPSQTSITLNTFTSPLLLHPSKPSQRKVNASGSPKISIANPRESPKPKGANCGVRKKGRIHPTNNNRQAQNAQTRINPEIPTKESRDKITHKGEERSIILYSEDSYPMILKNRGKRRRTGRSRRCVPCRFA